MVVKRDEATRIIKSSKKCTDYLKKNNGSSLYNCLFCGSGQGKSHTGAVKYYQNTNTCHCFSCDKTFDVFDLEANKMNLDVKRDFKTIISLLANELNLTIESHQEPQKKGSNITAPQKQEVPKIAPNDVTEAPKERANYITYYEECQARIENEAAVNYLQSRGISLETARLMGLGFDEAADPVNNPGNIAKSKYPTARIIAPVNQDYYIARAIEPNAELKAPNPKRELGGGEPALLNEAYLYDKDYGIIFITEGLFDCLSLIELEKPAIALNSTSNADKLIKLLEDKPTNATLILCLDNDEPGKKATEKLKASLDKLQIEYIEATSICGTYKDPNESLINDREQFIERVITVEAEAYNKCLGGFLERIQSEAYRPNKTNLSFVDELLDGGIIDQTLLLLMAAPGAGKSTLCQQIGEKLAENKREVLYLNLEMSREQMLAKAISARLYDKGIVYSARTILQGYNWESYQRDDITAEIVEYSKTNGRYIKYNPGAENGSSSIDNIIALLDKEGEKSKKNGNKASVVILDYLHLVSMGAEKLDEQELIKKLVIKLKEYAIKYNTFVIAIAAVNRASMKEGININSARDSSSLEYTADYVLSLNYYAVENGKINSTDTDKLEKLKAQPEIEMKLKLLKNRFGIGNKSQDIIFIPKGNTFIAPGEAYTFLGDIPFKDEDTDE